MNAFTAAALFFTLLSAASANGSNANPNLIFILADDPGYTDTAHSGSRY